MIATLLGAPALSVSGCGTRALPPEGDFIGPSFTIGHRIRDGFVPRPSDGAWRDIGVVIVGGGIAGLSAAWHLKNHGCHNFVVLEMEDQLGGTSRSVESSVVAYPWGAHYVPMPMPNNRALIRLLDEMGAIEMIDDDGTPVAAEQYLVRDPAERVFFDGLWVEGLYPSVGATPEDHREAQEFRDEINRWADTRDSQGRRAFAIPVAHGSDEPFVTELDSISMSEWLSEHGWTSPRLRWLVDYACRDDFGLTIDQTSAWAGVFYFASRVAKAGDDSQAVITWPEGNGRIVSHLRNQIRDHVRVGHAVTSIESPQSSGGKTRVVAFDAATGQCHGFRTHQVIFAAPQFIAPHIVGGLDSDQDRNAGAFEYGSWVVANVHLRERTAETGFPLSWDNVIHGSRSLGYVVATHQRGRDHGPTVWTWYYPMCEVDAGETRRRLLEATWEHWVDVVLTDLETPHPDIRALVTRIDIMRWGHAMVQPGPGFVWSDARRIASRPFRSVHFANTDLSGLALMEEAQYHGVRAAEEVLTARGIKFESLLVS